MLPGVDCGTGAADVRRVWRASDMNSCASVSAVRASGAAAAAATTESGSSWVRIAAVAATAAAFGDGDDEDEVAAGWGEATAVEADMAAEDGSGGERKKEKR